MALTLVPAGGLPTPSLRAAPGVRSQLEIDLDIVKDDLGITGNENDAWLLRRIGEVWSRFETYTSRYLAIPPATFTDDWGKISSTMAYANQPPVLDFAPVGSPFLRVTPVRSIIGIVRNGAAGTDPTAVMFEAGTGKLFSLGPEQQGHDVSRELRAGSVSITYTAGWDDIPPDLYNALIGVLTPLWAQRTGQSAGIPGGGSISSIDVTDLGALTFGGSTFVEAALKRGGGGIADPLLGPYTSTLDYYYDARVNMGSPLIPVTTMMPAGAMSAVVSPSAPVNPVDNMLWWNNSDGPGGGQLYIYYNDGNSQQWVPASARADGLPP